jgi:ADP-ribose pyrophosphatase
LEPEATRNVFDGTLLHVAVESWPSGDREVVHHPGACAVVPLTASGDVVLVRQLREAVRRPLLEIPAGIFDVEGEDGTGCAARELLEETGYRASDLRPLGSIFTSPGFTDERIELFAASAEPMEGGMTEDGIDVVLMPLEEAMRAIRDGRIIDAKSVCGLLLVGLERSL